jgi:hypothetical protein
MGPSIARHSPGDTHGSLDPIPPKAAVLLPQVSWPTPSYQLYLGAYTVKLTTHGFKYRLGLRAEYGISAHEVPLMAGHIRSVNGQ